MENIKKLIEENKLDLSTLVVFTRAENRIRIEKNIKQLKKVDLHQHNLEY